MLSDYLDGDYPGWGPGPFGPDPESGPYGPPEPSEPEVMGAPPAAPVAGGGGFAPGPGGGGGGGGYGGPGGGFSAPTFPSFNISPYEGTDTEGLPNFEPPPAFQGPNFTIPGFSELENDPGYQFRLGQGTKALNASAAAKGTLHTGGTLRDLIDYGQNYASGEYVNHFNRALQAHTAQYQDALDEYNAKYQGARDLYQSQYDPWVLQQDQNLQAWQSWIASQLAAQGLLQNAAFA